MAKTRGFLLGKFMPPHRGHLFLCDVALELVDELMVLVCSKENEEIEGNLRFLWMKESVRGNARVEHFHQSLSRHSSERANYWEDWTQSIRELHPEPIDMVFGSEDYVSRLAAEFDAEPFILDKSRHIVPVSSTQIRQNPEQHWKYIPRAVRPFYQKRVCLIGPEATGKSELSKKLAGKFTSQYVPEYGRSYDARYKRGKNWKISDFVAIAKGHNALQKQIIRRAGYACFEDTDLLQILVWAEYLLGRVPDELKEKLETWDFADLYLLLKPDIAWDSSESRYSGDTGVLAWFFTKLQAHLSDLKLPYQIVSGKTWEEREQAASAAVLNLSAQDLVGNKIRGRV